MKPNEFKGVLAAVTDGQNRPLYLVRTNGQVVYYRYHDMSPDEREIIVSFSREVVKQGLVETTGEQELLDFLDFKNDRKICG